MTESAWRPWPVYRWRGRSTVGLMKNATTSAGVTPRLMASVPKSASGSRHRPWPAILVMVSIRCHPSVCKISLRIDRGAAMAFPMPTSCDFLRAAIVSAAMVVGTGTLAAEYELVSTVALSRHGVRSPIAGHLPLATIAADPWPSWPVPSGHLTPRGAERARLLGPYYAEYYAAQGLFPTLGCPPTGRVIAWADVDQRTLVTAQSLIDGMFPGCKLAPGSLIDAKIDPLFHPTRAGVCKVDPARARRSVIASAGG